MLGPRGRRWLLASVTALAAVLAGQFLAQAPASAALMYDQGGFATSYAQDGTLQIFRVATNIGNNSKLYHYYGHAGENLTSEVLDDGLPFGEKGFPSAINYGTSLQVFYKSGGALIRKYYNAGWWTTETVVGSGVNSSPATAVDISTLHTAYVTSSGALVDRWNSGGGWSSQTVVPGSCDGSFTPAMGNFNGQLHILANCVGSWIHFWKDPGSPWTSEFLGQRMSPGTGGIALSTGNGEFDVVGNATDGKLWRWWYTSNDGWREQPIANGQAAGRVQVGWFNSSLHAAWVDGTRMHNSWLNGSTWSDEPLACNFGACSDVDAVALGTSYFLVDTQEPYHPWRWTPSDGWRQLNIPQWKLAFVKTKNTGSGMIEVHQTPDPYQSFDMHVTSGFSAAEDGNGTFEMVGNKLVYFKTRNTGSGKVELHYRTAESNFSDGVSIPTWFDVADGANGVFNLVDDGIVFIKTRNTGSGMIEVHKLPSWNPQAPPYLSTATNIPLAEADNGVFQMSGESLVFIKTRNTGSGKIEVHITGTDTAGSCSFCQWSLHRATVFNAGDRDNGTFSIRSLTPYSQDLIFIKTRNTSTGKVELFVASSATDYQQQNLATATAYNVSDGPNGWWNLNHT